MNRTRTGTEKSEWTQSDLQQLLAALKTSVPEQERTHTYTEALQTVDWQKIAFPPFSPEACREKWGEILRGMRRTRSLTELIVEAEDAVAHPVQDEKGQYAEEHQLVSEANNSVMEISKQVPNPLQHTSQSNLKRKRIAGSNAEGKQCTEDAEGLFGKPPFNGCFLYCVEQLASEFSKKPLLKVWAQRWRDLTEIEKQGYRARSEELKDNDWIKFSNNVMTKFKQQSVPQEQSATELKKPKHAEAPRKKKKTSPEISHRPSDSEDEVLEDSSNEKEDDLDLKEEDDDDEEEEEEEEEDDDIMFEMYRW